MAKDDFKEAKGILYSKPIKKGDKKDGTKYEVQQLVLELDGSYENKEGKWVSNTYLMLFTAGRGVAKELDSYDVKDPIVLSFLMTGKQYKKKDGTYGYDNNLYATKIGHADINYGGKTHEGKITTTPREEIPVMDDTENDNLPF